MVVLSTRQLSMDILLHLRAICALNAILCWDRAYLSMAGLSKLKVIMLIGVNMINTLLIKSQAI